MRTFKGTILLALVLSMFCSVLSPLSTLKVYATESTQSNEPYSYDESTGTLIVRDDVVVTKNGSGEYVSPFIGYKDTLSTVILEESVNEISYAFYGLEIDRLIIKNKNITIKTGLAGATVNCIEFTEDVSDMMTEHWDMFYDTGDAGTPPSGNGFNSFTMTKYMYQYGCGTLRPITTTNLGTDSSLLDDDSQLPKLGSSNDWDIWGLGTPYLIPNQSRDIASRLAFTFYFNNNHRYCVAEGWWDNVSIVDIPIVYGMKATLDKTEYEAGTVLSADDIRITVQGIVDSSNGNAGSYWNTNINDWVGKNDSSVPANVYNTQEVLSKYTCVDGKYYLNKGSYVYVDQYWLYTSEYGGDPYEVFLGKLVDGVLYYSYDGENWIATTLDESDASYNKSREYYSNDRGEYFDIYIPEDGMYSIGKNYYSEYVYLNGDDLYRMSYKNEDRLVDIGNVDYVQIGDKYYAKEDSFQFETNEYDDGGVPIVSTNFKYTDSYGYDVDCFIGKWVGDKIWYSWDGVNWHETSYTDEYSASGNPWGDAYEDDKGNCYEIVMLDESPYIKDGNNYFSAQYVEDGGQWYKRVKSKEVLDDFLQYVSSATMECDYYDESTGRYYDYYTCLRNGSISQDHTYKIESGTVYEYDWDNKSWSNTGFSTADEFVGSLNGWETVFDITGYVENDGSFYKNYYHLNNGVWQYVDAVTGVSSQIDLLYTSESNLPLSYDSLTDAKNLSASSLTASLSNTPQIMAVSSNPVVIVEGTNEIELEYYGLRTKVTVTGTPASSPTPSYSVRVVDKYYDSQGQLESQSVRSESVVASGTSYSYHALTTQGYAVTSASSYDGTVTQDIEIVFTYKKEASPTPSPSPTPTPDPVPEPEPEPSPEPVPDPTPEYKPKTYKVTFMVDGVKYYEVFVNKGDDTELPKDPTKDKYEFIGWDKDLTNVKKNITTEAEFKKIPEVPSSIEEDDVIDLGDNVVIERKSNVWVLWLIFFLLIVLSLMLFIILLLWKSKEIPFRYVLDKKKKEMIITGYTGNDTTVVIEETYVPFLRQYTVSEIAERAFYGLDDKGKPNFNSKIVKVVIPRTVRELGRESFKHCDSLKEIKILNPDCVIGEDAYRKFN